MATAAIWGCCVKRVWLYCLPGTPTLPNSIVRAGRPNIPAWLTQSWRVMLIAVLFMVGSERVGALEGVLVFVQSAPAISLRGRVMHESWIMHEFAACLSFVVGGFLLFLTIDKADALRFLRHLVPFWSAVVGGGLAVIGFGILFGCAASNNGVPPEGNLNCGNLPFGDRN